MGYDKVAAPGMEGVSLTVAAVAANALMRVHENIAKVSCVLLPPGSPGTAHLDPGGGGIDLMQLVGREFDGGRS